MNFAQKLLLGSVTVLLASSTLNTVYSYNVSETQLREEFASSAERIAESIGVAIKPHVNNQEELCRVAGEATVLQELERLVISHEGKVLCAFGNSSAEPVSLSAPEETRKSIERTRVYTTFASVECGLKDTSPLDVEVGINFTRLDKSLAMLRRNLLQNTVALCLGASIFLLVFSMVVRRRLGRLTEACASIQGGNLDVQVKVRGNDEIAKVGQAIERMARELKLSADEKDRQRQTMIQTSKMSALGEMAGGVAHEINNPVAIIKMNASHLGELIAEDPIDRELMVKMAQTIERTCDRISKIVSGLRAFSRDGSADSLEAVGVSAVIEETLVLCRDRFHNHEIEVQVENRIPGAVFQGRSVQISQVLLNLLNNAHDAIMESKGKKWIKIAAQGAGDKIEIRVVDSNPGIPEDVQKKIFQPFFTTKEVGKGTGMGLSISMGILKAHQGELFLDKSSPNTCFVIQLPKYQEGASAEGKA